METHEGPVSERRSPLVRALSRETWAFAWHRTWAEPAGVSLWFSVLVGGLLLPSGIGLAVSATTANDALIDLGLAAIGVGLFSYWLLGRPGDVRDIFHAFLTSKPRVAGGLYTVGFAAGATWCAVRAERLLGASPDIDMRLLVGSTIGLAIIAVLVIAVKLGASEPVQLILGLVLLVPLAPALVVVLPRHGDSSDASLAWALPIVGLTLALGAAVFGTLTIRNRVKFRVGG